MCNLYSETKGRAAIRGLFRVQHDRTGNLPSFPAIFPDQMAPIVRNADNGNRELMLARWGMPGPLQYGGAPVTNIRNVSSPHWRGWLSPKNRCIVPATAFCEYAVAKPRKTPTWFAMAEDRPLFAFAGLWTPWRGIRGTKGAPVEGEHELFGFLTTEANAIVAPIHPKAMPVILTTPEEVDLWLEGEMQLALAWPELMYGDLEAAERYAAEHVAFCAERRVEQFRLWGANYQAGARAMREPTEENVAALRGAIAANNRSGGYFSDSIFKSYLAEALLMSGEIAGAESALQDAFAFVKRSGERFWLADLYRVDGQIALRRPETDRARAEACFLKAIEIAHGQEARMLELRAATDLSRLWREAGAPNDPRALLEPILAVIEDGETTRDVRNARALLAEIG